MDLIIKSSDAWGFYNTFANNLRESIREKTKQLKIQEIYQILFANANQDGVQMTNFDSTIIGCEYIEGNIVFIVNEKSNTLLLDLADYRISIVDLLNTLETLENYENSTL